MKKEEGEPMRMPRFHPVTEGCVAKDAKLARAVEERYRDELASASANTYRSLMSAETDRGVASLFAQISEEEMQHFRLVGELIIALGGNPMLRTQIRTQSPDLTGAGAARRKQVVEGMLREAVGEKKYAIDRYQTLMGHTADRVVRSVISCILSDEQSQLSHLLDAIKQLSC